MSFTLSKTTASQFTGSNLRNIMLLVGKTSIVDLCAEDSCRIEYHEIKEEEVWRVGLANEMIDALWGENVVEGFSRDELGYILSYACAS